ncbi:MAG: hypothetical protein K2X93_00265 [Candidatus Obscuribacterales bacterium]|nr:hypothetical protein [Candidatus Obscuribacterales bacterium]
MSTLEKLSISLSGYEHLGIESQGLMPLSDDGKAWWTKLTTANGSIEGKLHLPVAKTVRLVIFEPGFPGGSSTDFETHRLPAFLAAGYAIFTVRHNGSLLTGAHSDYYICCPPRQEKAKDDGQEALGDRDAYTIKDWLVEPLIAMEALCPAFSEVILMGHSFGSLAIVSSIKELCLKRSPLINKVKRIVSLAGATGRLRSDKDAILSQWGEYLETDWARERVSLGEPSINLFHLRTAYGSIHKWKDCQPPSADFIFVHPWGDTEDSTDEYISTQEPLDLIVSLGKGTLVIDKTQQSDTETGALAHDMAALTTDIYLKLADLGWTPEKQILTLDRSGIK